MENHSNNNSQTAQPVSQNDRNTDVNFVPQATLTVEGQGDAEYKFPDLGTVLSLHSIREVADLIDQGVSSDFVPWACLQVSPIFSRGNCVVST
jgi:hypothetical protein